MPAKLTASQIVLRSVSEDDWMDRVTAEAALRRWWVFHDHDSRRNKAGFPDLVMIRPPRVLFVELKTETGRTKPLQAAFGTMIARCPGVEYYLWRPRDAEEVERVLA